MVLPSLFSFPDTTDLFEQLDKYAEELSRLDKVVQSGVIVEGDAAGYALVWEWGNARQTKKGPKTTLGINPDGKKVWLTIQAPKGYINILTHEFMAIVDEELAHVKFNEGPEAVYKQISKAAQQAAVKMAQLIKEYVPVDSGDLQSSIKPAGLNEIAAYDIDVMEDDEFEDDSAVNLENE